MHNLEFMLDAIGLPNNVENPEAVGRALESSEFYLLAKQIMLE